MIKKCEGCGGNVDYSISEIQLIPDTYPQKAGLEGMCVKCSLHYYIKFVEFESTTTDLEADERF